MNLLPTLRRALIVAPHADDETIGCGGLIARLRDEGCEVFVMVATVADFNYYPVQSEAPVASDVDAVRMTARTRFEPARASLRVLDGGAALALAATPEQEDGAAVPLSFVPGRRRLDELSAAMRVLDVSEHEVLFTDAAHHLRLDHAPRIELVKRIEKDARLSLDAIRPDLLVLPAPSYNQDHEAVFRAGIAASRPHPHSGKARVGTVLTCDMPHLSWGADRFQPQLYVDISRQLPRKLEALACHRSQLRPAPDHTSLEAVEALARLRGIEASTDYAEAYSVHRIQL